MSSNVTNSSDSSYLHAVCANQRRAEEIRRTHGYTERDHVTVYTLPKGQKGKKYSGFSYKTVSPKARKLQQTMYSLKGQILKAEYANLPAREKADKLHYLKAQLKYNNSKLNAELASSPRVGIIVLEEDEA